MRGLKAFLGNAMNGWLMPSRDFAENFKQTSTEGSPNALCPFENTAQHPRW
jgi:hypothetical protein